MKGSADSFSDRESVNKKSSIDGYLDEIDEKVSGSQEEHESSETGISTKFLGRQLKQIKGKQFTQTDHVENIFGSNIVSQYEEVTVNGKIYYIGMFSGHHDTPYFAIVHFNDMLYAKGGLREKQSGSRYLVNAQTGYVDVRTIAPTAQEEIASKRAVTNDVTLNSLKNVIRKGVNQSEKIE